MKILPSLRERRRYVVFESSEETGRDELMKAVISSVHSLFGDVEASEIRPQLVEFSGKAGILRCTHAKVEELRAALACIHEIGGKRISLRVVGVSGTIRGAKEKFYWKVGQNG